jgi:probable F420-dependent oxidoreductase
VVNISAHPSSRTASRYADIAAHHGERFILGLGATPGRLIDYLDALDGVVPVDRRVLGTLSERTIAVAAERSAGAHPFLTTPAHTRRARAILGPQPLLAPEHKVLLERDSARARAASRAHLDFYLQSASTTGSPLITAPAPIMSPSSR